MKDELIRFFKEAYDQTPIGVYVVRIIKDEFGKPINWSFLYVNDAFTTLAKREKSEFIDRVFTDIYPNGDSKWLDTYSKICCDGETIQFDEYSKEWKTFVCIRVVPLSEEDCCLCYIRSSTANYLSVQDRNNNVLQALCIEYSVVYLCDLKKDTLEIIKLNPFSHSMGAEKVIPDDLLHSYSARFKWFYDHVVVKESCPDYWDQLKPDHLMKTLENREVYELRHRTIYTRSGNEYFSLKIVRLHTDEDHFQVIIGILPIGDLVRKEQENQKRLEEAVRIQREENQIISSISTIYSMMYVIDLKKDRYEEIYVDCSKYRLGNTGCYSKAASYICDFLIDEENRERMKGFCSLDSIVSGLKNENSVACEYRTKEGHWHLARFIAKKRDENGDVSEVLYVVNVIDESKQKELDYQSIINKNYQALEERDMILTTLLKEYDSVYVCDLEKDTIEALKESNPKTAIYDKVVSYSSFGRNFYDEWVIKESCPDMDKILNPKNLMHYFLENSKLSLVYQINPDDRERTYIETNLVRLPSDDFKMVMGSRYVDTLIQEQNKQKKELQEALDAETVKNEIISAISTLYLEIAVIDLVDQTYEMVAGPDLSYAKMFKTGSIQTLKELLMTRNIHAEFHDDITDFFDFSTLQDRLKNRIYVQMDMKAKSGSWYTCSLIAKKRDDKGNVVKVLMAVNDITEKKEQEVEYQEQLKIALNLAQQSKMDADRANEAKSNFLRRMSHDIRTPINGIRGMVEISEYYKEDAQKQQECRDKIWHSTDHLLSLVNDVLDMGKLESGKLTLKKEPFSLKKVLQEVNSISQAQAEDYQIRYIAKDHNEVEHDFLIGSPVYLKRIFLNFTSNAIKYNREDGCVWVSGHELSFDGKVAWYEFSCEDNGIGMSEEFQKHAFEPFTQEDKNDARTKYTGTGLGLAITKQLIDLMHGELELYSCEGKGTKFVFRLPFEVDFEHHQKQEDNEYTSVQFDGIHALLVEDNELNAEIAMFLLNRHGVHVQWVQNGQLAVNEVKKKTQKYDVIFMDIMMPVMNGLEAAEAIRNLGFDTPIFAMTANAFTDDTQKSLDVGMNEHLIKPLQEREIVKMLLQYTNKES